MPPPSRRTLHLAAVVLLRLVVSAVAHGQDGEVVGMEMGSMSRPTITPTPDDSPLESYFRLKKHSALLLAHIVLMTLDWVFILPLGVMLSISRSRLTLPVQGAFLALNTIAVIPATIYNAQTPEFYPNNIHNKLGWSVTGVISVQFVLGILRHYGRARSSHIDDDGAAFRLVCIQAMAEHERFLNNEDERRISNDSGQGTEPNTESLRSQSISLQGSSFDDVRLEPAERRACDKRSLKNSGRLSRYLSRKLPGLLSPKILRSFLFLYNAIDRLILLVGFVVLASGFVTYGGLFKGNKVYSGLAHFIKGGVFFWLGILTLGRWAGCFADIGWAWNIKPATKNRPSAEFVESLLVFFYGATNIFLEHLNAWGSAWSAQDLEHVSITIMFIGGGLCGILIDSRLIRTLLTTPSPSFSSTPPQPSTTIPINPLPALIIFLLGIMMSSHHQESLVSTTLHKQWGMLLAAAACARAVTYLLVYLRPPTSIHPGRPPTELLAAFALMAGGALFMCSARDVVEALELYSLDAMFVFTVAVGVVTFLMAWILVVLIVGGLARR